MTATTIKVPVELRDRLAELARRERTTLAAVITRLLEEAEERAFWEAVHAAHAGMSDAERVRYAQDPTLADDLADEADDALSAEDAW